MKTLNWLLKNNAPCDKKEKNIEIILLQVIQFKIKQALSKLKFNHNCVTKQEFPPNSFENWKEIQSFLNEKSDQINSEIIPDKENTQNLENELITIRSNIRQLQSRKSEIEEKIKKSEKINKQIETNLKVMNQNQVLLNEMCTDVSILCENENKMNKELEELFNEKPFEKFDCSDISKLLWKMDLSKYQQIFMDNNVNGEFISLVNDETAIWEQIGIEKADIYKIMFNFEMMKCSGFSQTFYPDYDDECCVCSHNTPQKTLHLLKEYDMKVSPELILKNNLCSPVLTFTALWKHILGKNILSPSGIQIMTGCKMWKNIHKQHLRRLGNKESGKRSLDTPEEEMPRKKRKLTHNR